MKYYKELLKDGRWQIRKSEIMSRDGYTCRVCGAKAANGTTLNVHHLLYRSGAAPWEYCDNELVTLCERCHKKTHDEIKRGLYDIKVGDFVSYSHGDFENYGVIYDADLDAMTARMASIDIGSDYGKLWLETVDIKDNGELLSYNGRAIERERDISLESYVSDEDDEEVAYRPDYFFECLADCLLHIREYYEHDDIGHFEIIDRYMDEMEELSVLNGNLGLILENNSELYEYFRVRNAL